MGKKDKDSKSPTVQIVQYSEIPEIQKHKWVITEDIDVAIDYKDTIEWIRFWGTRDGCCFEGIRSLRCKKGGCPLVEVEVIYGLKSAKFLISRASLYVLAFCCALGHWRVFHDDEIKIRGEGCVTIETKPCYMGEPWTYVGPKEMIAALEMIESEDEVKAVKGCQIFFVHLSEACRFNVVENLIERSLIPSFPSTGPLNEEDDAIEFPGSRNSLEIMKYLRPATVDMQKSIEAPVEVGSLIKNYSDLSIAWYLYALTDKEFCFVEGDKAKECGLLNSTSLRHSLAVLCNTNLKKKILSKWKGKYQNKTCPPYFPVTPKILKKIEEKINDLEE
ncbi:hypothetical protein CASFOL_040053 [Castilleja foliolosa]|uniref:Uncharacterized protein n=1 Tax=Castilleja foliolosa TaxID=1961234 RepID=A0ABD3BEQ6_9LAMI